MRFRKLSAALVGAGVAGALVLGGAMTAHAATGYLNQGVRDIVVNPSAPAVNFDTPGTTGTITFNGGDGTPAGTYSLQVGDVMERSFTLPAGLEFQNCATPDLVAIGETVHYACSTDKRTLTMTWTVTTASSGSTDFNSLTVTTDTWPALAVVSTGPVAADATITSTYTPYTGLTTAAPSATGPVVQEFPADSPVLAGALIAGLGLGGAAVATGVNRRRKKTAAQAA